MIIKPFAVVDIIPPNVDDQQTQQAWEKMQVRLDHFITKTGLSPDDFGYTRYMNHTPKYLRDSFIDTFCSHLDCDILLLVAERVYNTRTLVHTDIERAQQPRRRERWPR